ncbi:Xaa-Pro peptidase family protein [uncultured Odoribacter sp.]|uniref:M24 family metallopeptidase n=1 Tax=uncultured Odoribacter sp. TaxID=876416 RepID=UPI00260DED25|nr:Xaa-Pro peptidase family protein [uncultured Odoribacter sp.]
MSLEADLLQRRKNIQKQMDEKGMEACLLTIPLNLYYLCGYVFNGYYYLPVEGEPHLFVKRPVDLLERNVHFIRKPEQIPDLFRENGWKLPERLLLEEDELTYSETIRLQHIFELQGTGNITPWIRRMRMIKSAWEIQQMQETAEKQSFVYSQIPECYRPGMTDLELQYEIEYRMRREGSIGFFRTFGSHMEIFMGSVLAGENAEVPSPFDFALGGGGMHPSSPLGANGTLLKKGISVMIDMAGNYTAYQTDMTRIYAIGKLSSEAYKTHEISRWLHQEIIDTVGPGTACAEVYRKVEKRIKEAGLSAYFMGTRQQAHFVGHGVGLQINELPVLASRSKEVLQIGMTFAFEPKFVIPSVGAVGIENTFLVTANGLKKLTYFPEEIIPLE